MRIKFLFCGLLALVINAASAVHERRTVNQKEWQPVARAAAHHRLELRIVLHSETTDLIEQHAREISDPKSPRWRQFMKPAEISDILSPPNEAVAAVMGWLRSAGVEGRQSHDIIQASTTVEQAEALLAASYSIYQHSSGKRALRTREYSIPDHLQGTIDFVTPTIHCPHPGRRSNLVTRSMERNADFLSNMALHLDDGSSLIGPCGNGSYPNRTITPACIRAAYSVDWNVTNANTTVGIFDPDESWFNNDDLQTYLELYNPAAAAANSTFERLTIYPYRVGEKVSSSEVDLDTQMSMGLIGPAKGVIVQAVIAGIYGNYSWGFTAEEQELGQDYFLDFLHGMIYNETVPPIQSISAGANEEFTPYRFASRACAMFAASGARGVTWIVASGDSGPMGCIDCYHNTTLAPGWPNSCPWVMNVGATVNPFNETAATPLTSGNLTSGGGFSNYFPRPWYQDEVVPPYIESSVSSYYKQLSGWNASGRAFPDVAAFGDDVPVINEGRAIIMAGTSASAPLWAGLIALLNDYEAGRGKPTLGFINPWLYSLKNGELRDITVGNGIGFNNSQPWAVDPYPFVGYNATVGWDALTGLGVPVFDKLRAALP